jgi:hypothetical protein
MLKPLQTARLNLTAIQPGDAEQLQAIFPQWEVVRYLASTVPWPYAEPWLLGHRCRSAPDRPRGPTSQSGSREPGAAAAAGSLSADPAKAHDALARSPVLDRLRAAWRDWKSALVVVCPATVVAWHRRGFSWYWTRRSRPRGGRPQAGAEIRRLVREMALANPSPRSAVSR